MSGNKVVFSINVTEKGEPGAGAFIASAPKFEIRCEGDSVIKAVSKVLGELKKHAFKAAIDDEVSEQQALPLAGKKSKKKAGQAETPEA